MSGGVLCVIGVLVCGALLPRFVGYDARVFHAGMPLRSEGSFATAAPSAAAPASSLD